MTVDLPLDLAREVAVTGSEARGWADEWSDVELMACVDELPSLERVREWYPGHLAEVEAWDGVVWADGEADGRKLEIVWQLLADVEDDVDALLRGEPRGDDALATADAIATAHVVRGDRLPALQERLREYPPALASGLIEQAVAPWESQPKLGAIRRFDRLPVTKALVRDADAIWRILHAVNRRWEPRTKWVARRLAELPVKPERAAERIEAALVEPDPARAVRTMTELALEALDLVPADVNVSTARRRLREVLALL